MSPRRNYAVGSRYIGEELFVIVYERIETPENGNAEIDSFGNRYLDAVTMTRTRLKPNNFINLSRSLKANIQNE